MEKQKNLLKRMRQSAGGALIEYCFLVATVALVAVPPMMEVGDKVSLTFQDAGGSENTGDNCPPDGCE